MQAETDCYTVNSPYQETKSCHLGWNVSTLHQGIPGETDGGADGGWIKKWAGEKREEREYSEELRPSFVRWKPIRFYGLQDGRDSDGLISKINILIQRQYPQDA